MTIESLMELRKIASTRIDMSSVRFKTTLGSMPMMMSSISNEKSKMYKSVCT